MKKGPRFASNLAAKVFSLGLNLAISFFLTPFIIEQVGAERYGFVGLANDFVDVARIASVALNSMALRFIAVSLHRGDTDAANRYFSSVFLVNILMSAVFLLPFGGIIVFLDKLFRISASILPDVRLLWVFLLLNFLLSISGTAFSAALFAKNRIDKESFRSAEALVLRAVFLLVCYRLFAPKAYYVGLSSCVLTIYVLATNIYYTKKYLPALSISPHFFDKKAVKTLFASGGWNCLTKVSTILYTGLDLFFVNLFVSESAMGTVSVSKAVPNTLLSVFVILSTVFLPRLTEDYAKDHRENMMRSTVFSVKILGLFAAIPLVFLGVFGDTFYRLWTPTENATQLWLLSLVGSASFLVSLATQNLWNIFTVTNRVKTSSIALLVSAGCSLLAVLLSMLFVKDATARTFIIVGCSAIFNLILTVTFLPLQAAKCLGLPKKTYFLPMTQSLGLLLCLLALFSVLKTVVPIHSWAGLLLMLCTVFGCCMLLGFVTLFTRAEKQAVLHFLKEKRTRS